MIEQKETTDGIRQTDDGVVSVTVDGTTYELAGLEPDDYPVLRERLQRRRLDHIAAVTEQLADLDEIPPQCREAAKKELWDRA